MAEVGYHIIIINIYIESKIPWFLGAIRKEEKTGKTTLLHGHASILCKVTAVAKRCLVVHHTMNYIQHTFAAISET